MRSERYTPKLNALHWRSLVRDNIDAEIELISGVAILIEEKMDHPRNPIIVEERREVGLPRPSSRREPYVIDPSYESCYKNDGER